MARATALVVRMPRPLPQVTAEALRQAAARPARTRRSVRAVVGTDLLVDPNLARQRLSLRQVADRGGTSVSAARRYARHGLLPDPLHTPTWGWLFPPRAVERLALIRAARGIGLSLAQIAILCQAVEDAASAAVTQPSPRDVHDT